MVEHVARFPWLRDRSVFVGNPDDVVDLPLGPDLPTSREWTEEHFDFTGYVTGERPDPAERTALRARLGYARRATWSAWSASAAPGSATHLLRRVAASYDEARRRIPGLRMVVVTGPRIDPASLDGAGGCRGARLPARPRPAPRRVRHRGRAGRSDHDDGADRQRPAVPLLPARAPLRAADPRPPPARAAPRRPVHGLPRRRPVAHRRRASRRAPASGLLRPRANRRRRPAPLSSSPS